MKTEIYIDNSGNKFEASKLLPCPFCGSYPDILFIGNNHTKSRKVTIKCKNADCRVQLTNAGIRFDHEKVAGFSINAWNNRI